MSGSLSVEAKCNGLVAHGLSATVPITDGGGQGSSADWLRPRANVDLLRGLRKTFEGLVSKWSVVQRLRDHVAVHCSEPLFSPSESDLLRAALVDFLNDAGFPCTSQVAPHQPFLLEAWKALAQLLHDKDENLPDTLSIGVSIETPIPASGIWDLVDLEANFDEADLEVHTLPWASASSAADITRQLLDKDVQAGHLMKLERGEAEARERWGHRIAAGKLGVVQVPGKKPRLAVSGANRRCRLSEKIRVPSLESVQRFVSLVPESTALCALSFDIRGAHKLVRVHPREQGYSTFVFEDTWYVYRTCYFGARWSAYWFGRVGAQLTRFLHQFIYICHGLFLYIDDGLLLVPAEVAPLVACTALMFLVALGVPLSYEKLELGFSLQWIGWHFNWERRAAALPTVKREKLLAMLKTLLVPGAVVEKTILQQCIGLLVWYCGGAYWLKPWLQCLYKLLFKPHCVFRSIPCSIFGELKGFLTNDLWVSKHVPNCDIKAGWKLHSVGNSTVFDVASTPLLTPRLKHGSVECVFYEYSHWKTKTCKSSAWAAQLFYNAVLELVPVPLQVLDLDAGFAAADAYATAEHAGLGGWWLEAGTHPDKFTVRWFSFQITWDDLPTWFRHGQSVQLQSCIAALEALAQLLLLLARAESMNLRGNKIVFRFHQLCDNLGAASASRKQLTMSEPLSFVLQAAGFWCCKLGVALCPHHVAGERNFWADELSRNQLEGFCPALRWQTDVCAVLQTPWS